MRILKTIFSALVVVIMTGAGVALAGPATSEIEFEHSTNRLLAGTNDDGQWTAGVEFDLKPGWKTYWRIPGDAGVPPQFGWDGSSNMAKIKVAWPAPRRYRDKAGMVIGYKKQVVFPVTGRVVDSKKPVHLVLKLYYAVCSTICVPGFAELTVDIPATAGSTPASALIARFGSKVPKPDGQQIGLDAAKLETIDGKTVLSARLSGKIDDKTDILVEGYEDAFFHKPVFSASGNGGRIFHIQVDGLNKPDELIGQKLKLTILSSTASEEKTITVR